ncbi:MAG: DUF2288 domain-containing protein [Halieaceae bacterium]
MASGVEERRKRLFAEYLSSTGRIPWNDLQKHYAAGSVVYVAEDLDLVEVAVQLGLDNTAAFEEWIAAGTVAPVSDDQAMLWFESEKELWAVVAAPWVLVQDGPARKGPARTGPARRGPADRP